MSAHEHPNPNPQDDPSASSIVSIGVTGSLVVVVLVILIASLYYSTEDRFVEQRQIEPTVDARIVFDQQRSDLSAPPTWVDREKRIARVPIEHAMQWVVRNPNAQPASAPAQP